MEHFVNSVTSWFSTLEKLSNKVRCPTSWKEVDKEDAEISLTTLLWSHFETSYIDQKCNGQFFLVASVHIAHYCVQ